MLEVVLRPGGSGACRPTAPWAIQRVISSISAGDSGGLSWGISALPSCGVIWSIRKLSSGLPGDDGRVAALAPLEHAVERRHHVAAAGLGRLVAALALGLEDRPDLLVIADLRPGRGGRGGLGRVLTPGLLPALRLLIRGARRERHRDQDHQGPCPVAPSRLDRRHHLGCSTCRDPRSRRSHPAREIWSPWSSPRFNPARTPADHCWSIGRIRSAGYVSGAFRPGRDRSPHGQAHCDARSSCRVHAGAWIISIRTPMHQWRRQDRVPLPSILLERSPRMPA